MDIRSWISLPLLLANTVFLQPVVRQSHFSHVVKGRVVNSSGGGVADAELLLLSVRSQEGVQGFEGRRTYAVTNANGEFRIQGESSLPAADYLLYASSVSDAADIVIGPPFSRALRGTGGAFAGLPIHVETSSEVDDGEVLPIYYGSVTARVVTREGKPMLSTQQGDSAPCLLLRLRDEHGDTIAEEGLSRAVIDSGTSSISFAVPEGKWTVGLLNICTGIEYAAATKPISIDRAQCGPVGTVLTPRREQRASTHGSYTRAQALAELERVGIPFTEKSLAERAERGNTRGVELLLAAGMTPNVKTSDGSPALMAALRAGYRTIVRNFLRAAPTSIARRATEPHRSFSQRVWATT